MTETKEIRLGNIHIDDSLQLRVEGTDPDAVADYARMLKNRI